MHVLLADSSNESAYGCQALLRHVDDNLTVYRATSLPDTLSRVKDCPRIDLIVWHAGEQTEEKFRLVRRLADAVMGIPIIIFAKSAGASQVAMAIKAGANGYIPLPSRRALIVEIIRLVLSGGTYFPTSLLAEKFREDGMPPSVRPSVQEEARRHLTPRQKDVLELMVEGLTNKEIADSLGIAEATAKQHVSALLRAMQVRTRDEAIQLARLDTVLAG